LPCELYRNIVILFKVDSCIQMLGKDFLFNFRVSFRNLPSRHCSASGTMEGNNQEPNLTNFWNLPTWRITFPLIIFGEAAEVILFFEAIAFRVLILIISVVTTHISVHGRIIPVIAPFCTRLFKFKIIRLPITG